MKSSALVLLYLIEHLAFYCELHSRVHLTYTIIVTCSSRVHLTYKAVMIRCRAFPGFTAPTPGTPEHALSSHLSYRPRELCIIIMSSLCAVETHSASRWLAKLSSRRVPAVHRHQRRFLASEVAAPRAARTSSEPRFIKYSPKGREPVSYFGG